MSLLSLISSNFFKLFLRGNRCWNRDNVSPLLSFFNLLYNSVLRSFSWNISGGNRSPKTPFSANNIHSINSFKDSSSFEDIICFSNNSNALSNLFCFSYSLASVFQFPLPLICSSLSLSCSSEPFGANFIASSKLALLIFGISEMSTFNRLAASSFQMVLLSFRGE